ncbi:MAG TPA: FHA domain-containing protein, partial [Caldimonas sp.]
MSIKSWVLHSVQNIGAITGRADLPARDAARGYEPGLASGGDLSREAGTVAEAKSVDIGHLGIYAPLIGAVRRELERFVASHLRLHVVIADRDRFVLTAIGVRSPGGDESRDVLQQFMKEFRPEQVKRFLAREVIGRLPNAAVIDLAQFAGLTDLDAHDQGQIADEYGELLAALRLAPQAAAPLPYEVSILGRWMEGDALASTPQRSRGESLMTPLSGERWEFDIHDRDGVRTVALVNVVPGRRYVIGKGAHCDIRVNGAYTSRRHAELWIEHDRWHVADVGSTN